MSEQLANLFDEVEFDSTIKKKHLRTYHPIDPNQLGQSDVIRILINNQDAYTLPSESYLKFEGELTNEKDEKVSHTTLTNNAFAYLISELRYELAGQELINVKNVGLTSTLKGLLCFTPDDAVRYSNAGWLSPSSNTSHVLKDKKFSVCHRDG